MTAADHAGSRLGRTTVAVEDLGQPRGGARVSTMTPEPTGPPGYADPFGPALPPATTGAASGPARAAHRRRAAIHASVVRQRFWGVAILVLFLLGVTAAKWFAQ